MLKEKFYSLDTRFGHTGRLSGRHIDVPNVIQIVSQRETQIDVPDDIQVVFQGDTQVDVTEFGHAIFLPGRDTH